MNKLYVQFTHVNEGAEGLCVCPPPQKNQKLVNCDLHRHVTIALLVTVLRIKALALYCEHNCLLVYLQWKWAQIRTEGFAQGAQIFTKNYPNQKSCTSETSVEDVPVPWCVMLWMNYTTVQLMLSTESHWENILPSGVSKVNSLLAQTADFNNLPNSDLQTHKRETHFSSNKVHSWDTECTSGS